jgi:hypothetical protein
MEEKKYTQADLDRAVGKVKAEAARQKARDDVALQQLQVRWLRNAIEQAMRDTKRYHASVLTGRCIP